MMKRSFKLFLAALLAAVQLACSGVSAFAAEEVLLLDCDMDLLEVGAKTMLSGTDFKHYRYVDEKNTAASDVEVTTTGTFGGKSDAVTTSIAPSEAGKAGNSFYFNVNEATSKTSQDYGLDFKWAPRVYSGNVTYEFSLRAPDNITDGKQLFKIYIPINSQYINIMQLETNNNNVSKISVQNNKKWTTITRFKAGRWYNIAAVVKPGTKNVDYYLNGRLALENAEPTGTDIEYTGGRLRIAHQINEVSEGKTYTSKMAFDDVKMYIGTPDTAQYSAAVDADNSKVRVDNREGESAEWRSNYQTIYLAEPETDAVSFKSKLALPQGASAAVYTDESCSTEAQTVKEGCVAVITSQNSKVLEYYNISEREVLIDCDMEKLTSLAANTAIPVSSFTHDSYVSQTRLNNVDKTTTVTRAGEAGAAKDGTAFYIGFNGNTAAASPSIDYRWVPNVKSGKAVFEASVRAPMNYSTCGASVYVPYNGTYRTLFELGNDGKIGINGQYIKQWIPGRWYNFAVEFTIGEAGADFYLNGDLVFEDTVPYVNMPKGVVEVAGGTLRLEATAQHGCTDEVGFDDVKVYTSDYQAKNNQVALTSADESCVVNDAGVVFTDRDGIRLNMFRNMLLGNFSVYGDKDLENTATFVSNDCVVAASNDGGNVIKYYNIVSDGNIAVLVNGTPAAEIVKTRASAGIQALSRNVDATLYLATYNEGGLETVSLAKCEGDVSEIISVPYVTEKIECVKAMIFENASNKPVGTMIELR